MGVVSAAAGLLGGLEERLFFRTPAPDITQVDQSLQVSIGCCWRAVLNMRGLMHDVRFLVFHQPLRLCIELGW
jgi:hypothetical protein